MGLLLAVSCSDVLDEDQRSGLDPNFLKTETGIRGGVTALYAHLRNTYGDGYYLNACETGTDEYTWGELDDGNFKVHDMTDPAMLTPSVCRARDLWNDVFLYINTASGVIDNAPETTLPESQVAEARFFRAFDYFRLVETFGGVPLDQGSGELKYNATPTRSLKRNTVPEVYTKAIFSDMNIAIEKLPDQPRVVGGITKNVARLALAKAYLTYGWWLQNPNDIPTYPECDRKDPDNHDANWYFTQALKLAEEGIANPGPYKLQEYFYDVNLGQNDRNSECMMWADHTEKSEEFNGASLTWGNGEAPENYASWMVCWNYTNMLAQKPEGGTFNPVRRDAVQALGRPWTRMAPIQEVFTKTFADKVNDSRYDGTFTYVFRANWKKDGQYAGDTGINANGMSIKPGDAVLTFTDSEDGIVYPTDPKKPMGDNGVGAGTAPGRSDYVVGPSHISRFKYPILWKLGPYRTDSGKGIGQPNAGSTRPFVIMKFSEFYFIGAEAAVKLGKNDRAKELINVIRARAGKWRWDNNGNVAKSEDHSAEMVAATPATITINYILDERSREYFGEGYRWEDLVRTQTWAERAKTYTICGTKGNSYDAETFTRKIDKGHYLRPIPSSEIDALQMSAEDKINFQNPAYRDK